MLAPSLFLFIIMYVLSFFMVFGFDSWLIVWVGLEINMISFILLMFRHQGSLNMESCVKYFFIQATGSAMLVFLWMSNFLELNLFVLVLGYKLGAGPFFFWLPGVVNGIDWMLIFFLLGFQKVLPLLLMSMMIGGVILVLSVISLFVGCYGMFNQVNLSKLMMFSSIHHLGWMMLLMYLLNDYWIVYLMLYMVMIFPLTMYFAKFDLSVIDEFVEGKDKFILCVGVLSLAGIPPMLGFFLKMWAFKLLMDVSMFVFLFMIIFSVVMAYVYIKMMYKMILWEVDVNLLMSVYNVDVVIIVSWMYLIGMLLGFLILWV